MSKAPLVYLDWNVILSLKDGRQPQLLEILIKMKKEGIIKIPFSSVHIEEALTIKAPKKKLRKKRIEEHLSFVSKLSSDLYLYSGANVYDPVPVRESPFSVLKTLTGSRTINFMGKIMWGTFNLLSSYIIKRHFRKKMNLDPRILNNITSPNIIKKINAELGKTEVPENKKGIDRISIELLMEAVKQSVSSPVSIPEFEISSDLSSRFAALYSAFELIGYWPDSNRKKLPQNGFNDSAHAYHACHTSCFVTDDAKLRRKTVAAFEYFNSSTQIMSSNELKSILLH